MEAAFAEVDASIMRLFHWAAFADKYGGTVQETQLYGATVKINEPVGPMGIVRPPSIVLYIVDFFCSGRSTASTTECDRAQLFLLCLPSAVVFALFVSAVVFALFVKCSCFCSVCQVQLFLLCLSSTCVEVSSRESSWNHELDSNLDGEEIIDQASSLQRMIRSW